MKHEGETRAAGSEIHVPESDFKGLTVIDRSDVAFAIIYGVLFLWGLALTLISI